MMITRLSKGRNALHRLIRSDGFSNHRIINPGIFYRISNMVASQTSVSTQNADIQPSISHSLNNFKDDVSLHINRIYGNIKYIDFLVPAILGMTIMMSCMLGMGSTIAGERETGELARLFMTPTSVSTIIGGKIAAKLLIELVRALILIFMAVLLFNVSIKEVFYKHSLF